MNQEIKKKWVEALRSSDYKQGRGRLRSAKNKFCCLGVLCNLHAEAHPKIAAKQTDPNFYLDGIGILPNDVQKWAKLTDAGSVVLTKSVRATSAVGGKRVTFSPRGIWSLYDLNDRGCNFKQIADIIEEHL